jgi:hypothetical protein
MYIKKNKIYNSILLYIRLRQALHEIKRERIRIYSETNEVIFPLLISKHA